MRVRQFTVTKFPNSYEVTIDDNGFNSIHIISTNEKGDIKYIDHYHESRRKLNSFEQQKLEPVVKHILEFSLQLEGMEP